MMAPHHLAIASSVPASMYKLTLQGPRFKRTMESVQKDSGGYVNMSGVSTEMKTKQTPVGSHANFSSMQGMKHVMTGTDSSFRLKISATDHGSPSMRNSDHAGTV